MTETMTKRPAEYHFQHDWGGETPPSTTILDAVVDVVGEDRLATEPPLYRHVDPDALDRLFEPTARSERGQGSVTFTFAGCRIVLCSSGDIYVAPDADASIPGEADA
ncbi:MAG: HalOD1 output domain-containing protein [Haloferacaceae archaeon]